MQVLYGKLQIDRTRARRVVALALAIGSVMFAVLGVVDLWGQSTPAPIEMPAELP